MAQFFREHKRSDVGDVRGELWPFLRSALPPPLAAKAQDLGYVMALLKVLEEANKVMVVDGVVHILE